MSEQLPTLLVSPFNFNFANFSFSTMAGTGGIFSGGGGGVVPPVPPSVGNFQLLDGTDFLLLDGSNLTLL